MDKHAEMGVGTLIIFISMTLVAAVAAGVLIQTVGSLQEKGLQTGTQAKSQISTHLQLMEVSASDGRNRTLTDFFELVKLSPGSDEVKLSQMVITFSTYTKSSTLQYRGVGAPLTNSNTGYNTWTEQEIGVLYKYNQSNYQQLDWTWKSLGFDLNGDGISENVTVCRAGGLCPGIYDDQYVAFSISGPDGPVYVPLLDPSGDPADISGAGVTLGNNHTPIGTYGTMSTAGTTSAAWRIDIGQLIAFNEAETLEEDLDDDTIDDDVVINDTHAIVRLSSAGEIAIPLGMDLGTPGAISVDSPLISNGATYGYITISGTTDQADRIQENISFEIRPYKYGEGYFVAEYIEKGNNWVAGNIQKGDVVRIYVQAPGEIGEDEEIRINLIPKMGVPTHAIFTTPSVISTQRAYLYP